ncbi:DUF6207 family protein [Streptomyces sp. NBC_00775]|uniref:DUF6207 family protein n=1 Tax=unclassified Streptomyces TaxID=2593676 RepID=UPI003FA79EBA
MRCGRRATATADRTTRGSGQPGVRLRCYLDVRQELSTQPPARCCRGGRASRSYGWGFVLSVVHCGHGSGPSGVKGPGPVVASVGEPLTSGESGAK